MITFRKLRSLRMMTVFVLLAFVANTVVCAIPAGTKRLHGAFSLGTVTATLSITPSFVQQCGGTVSVTASVSASCTGGNPVCKTTSVTVDPIGTINLTNGAGSVTKSDFSAANPGTYTPQVTIYFEVDDPSSATGRTTISQTSNLGSFTVSQIPCPPFPPACPTTSWGMGDASCCASMSPSSSAIGTVSSPRPYGPAGFDPINVSTGVEAFALPADISVYNPVGPRAEYQLAYYSNRARKGYSSPGLPVGWVHNFDVLLKVNPDSLPDSWGDLQLFYPKGAYESISPELNNNDIPTGQLTPPIGAGYTATAEPSDTVGIWKSITLTWFDQVQWRFELLRGSNDSYSLTRIINPVGRAILLNWSEDRRLLSVVNDDVPATILYTVDYTDNLITSVMDCYHRKVCYVNGIPADSQLTVPCLLFASQLADETTQSPPYRFAYRYTSFIQGKITSNDKPLLCAITVPSATGSGTQTATINYATDSLNGGRVTSCVDAEGNRQEYTYHTNSGTKLSDNTLVTVKDRMGNVVNNWTQNSSFLVDAGNTDANGKSLAKIYDDKQNPHRPTRIVQKDGRYNNYTYDRYGNITKVVEPRPGSTTKGTTVTTTYEYDYRSLTRGRLIKVVRDGNILEQYEYYEPSGLRKIVSTPAPGTTNGAMVSTHYTYDIGAGQPNLGNILAIEGPGNTTCPVMKTICNYTTDGQYTQPAKFNQLLTITDNMGHVIHFRYDKRGNRTVVIDQIGNETNYSYNAADQLIQTILPATGQTGKGRGKIVNSYLYVGGPIIKMEIFDESGGKNPIRIVNYAYGAEGEKRNISGSTEQVTYTYDANYRQKYISDGKDNTVSYSYDAVGRLSAITYPLGDTQKFTRYDDAGRVLETQDGNGNAIHCFYADNAGKLTGITYPDNSSVSCLYDEYSNKIGVRDNQCELNMIYDKIHNILNSSTDYSIKQGPPAKNISYTYNPDGTRASMRLPDGSIVTYTYDGVKRLIQLEVEKKGQAIRNTVWSYLDNGLVQQQKQFIGEKAICYSTYIYNARNQLTRLQNYQVSTPTDVLLSDFRSITYDGTGNRTGMIVTRKYQDDYSGVYNYQYDEKNQLTCEKFIPVEHDPTYQTGYTKSSVYDNAGNPTNIGEKAIAYNANNQAVSKDYLYDDRGNPKIYNGNRLSFDYENRMTAYGNIMKAGYRGDNLRAWKEGEKRQYYLYDEKALVEEINSDGTIYTNIVQSIYGLISCGDTFYMYDPQGSVAHRIGISGLVMSNNVYDAWGISRASKTLDGDEFLISDPFGYEAKWGYFTDKEEGLILLTQRYYIPTAGRFLTRDPIGIAGGLNLYAYVNNNVENSTDTLGLTSKTITCLQTTFSDPVTWAAGGVGCATAFAATIASGSQVACVGCLAVALAGCASIVACIPALAGCAYICGQPLIQCAIWGGGALIFQAYSTYNTCMKTCN